MKNSALLVALVASVCIAQPSWEQSRIYGIGGILSLSYSPDGKKLVFAGIGGAQSWDVESWSLDQQLLGHTGIVRSATWSPDQSRIATAGEDGLVGIWDAATGTLMSWLYGHGDTVYSVAWSPDETMLASASADSTLILWDAQTGSSLCRLEGHGNEVMSVSWSPSGDQLVSGSKDRTVRLWRTADCAEDATLTGHTGWVTSVAWSAAGLASGSFDATLKIWDPTSGELVESLSNRAAIWSIAWAPDGDRIAVGASSNSVNTWSTSRADVVSTLVGHTNWARAVAWSPTAADEVASAAGERDQTLRRWDATTAQQTAMYQAHTWLIYSVRASPDGTKLVSAAVDGKVIIWDVATGAVLRIFDSEGDFAYDANWSPDGSLVAGAFLYGPLQIWDASSGELVRELYGHDSRVNAVVFSPDGSRLASASAAMFTA